MNFGDTSGPAPVGPDGRTRDRVLQAVSEYGPTTAAALAERLGLTPAGVRRHLDLLSADGLLEEREDHTGAGRRGRPARSYVLSDTGHQRLRGDYDQLATSVLRFLREHAGDEAVRAFARDRAAELAQRVRGSVEQAGPQMSERTEALAAALADQGYAASTRPVGTGRRMAGVQLCQGHCPVQHVAAEFPEFCEAEQQVFTDVLGVHVQRLASLAHGDHVCTTYVPNITTTDAERDPR